MNEPGIDTFRAAAPRDAEAIARLVNDAYRPGPGAAGWTHESALVAGERATADQVLALLAAADSVVLLGLVASTIVACVHVEKHGDACHIGMLAVNPDLQGAGLGKAMLAEAERQAVARLGCRRLVMQVLSARSELIAFYLRRGYRRTGEVTGYPLGSGVGVPRIAGLTVETLEKHAVTPIEFDTLRLRLRQWRAADQAPFAALTADPRVMEFFPQPLERAASDALAQRCASLIAERGWGFWAVERKDSGAFIGFIGLHTPAPELPCSPCVEIGWRLAHAHWGQGFATEGATGALRVGFEVLDLPEIVSFTAVVNRRSRAVMERLAMRPDEETFEHPHVPLGSPLREHCLYRLSRADWRAGFPAG